MFITHLTAYPVNWRGLGALARSTGLASVVLLLFAVFVASPAKAKDYYPPRATLHQGDKSQRGHLWSSYWAQPAGPNLCATGVGDGLMKFGPALHVGSGVKRLRIRFHKTQRPARGLVISAWTMVDPNGDPIGPARHLAYRLVKERHHGHLRWAALIKPNVASDLYLDVFARWKGTGWCGVGGGEGNWTFHVAP